MAGCQYALVAVSFSLIYRTCRFFHFAHSVAITCAPFVAYFLIRFEVPPPISWTMGIAAAGTLGLGMNTLVYLKLRQSGAQAVELLLASLGLMVAGHAIFSLILGDDASVIDSSHPSIGRLLFFGVRLSSVQLVSSLLSIASIMFILLIVYRSRAGALIRAVENDELLASAIGVPVRLVMNGVFLAGSAAAGTAGLLLAYDSSFTPAMGLRILLLGISASIIGGLETYIGAVFGALLIGLTQHVGGILLPSQWQDAGIFFVLIVILLIRPQGLLGSVAISGDQ